MKLSLQRTPLIHLTKWQRALLGIKEMLYSQLTESITQTLFRGYNRARARDRSSRVKSNDDNTFNLENFEKACAEAGSNLKMVSLSHVGNLDGRHSD